ncbi:helix-turn-helix transcriptional regulator [Actinoplanes derwentensis]|uniref:Regulatory protein, luxR family n=1 Tax=Actinoplanes derwentensis TaxID=113562 RepID=A0A1H2C893_9ACTN|nr:LuxR C-terminal-related transcriptional regulator [Actinoplanes derwentensis]GID86526.1 hypothetical protein Ade03nite_54500 [Actinoplanes derwentensis]SDT66663.1 regulatory protein, luxR family [Actinoplanes derwentensis]
MAQVLPLIGRDREMRFCTALLDWVAPDRPAVLLVEGPPDSGRARLLREVAEVGRQKGATVTAEPDRVALVRNSALLVVTTDLAALARHPDSAGAGWQVAETHRVLLGPLPAGEVRRLLAVALPGVRAGARLMDLTRVAAGRPGAVVRLVADLRAEGLLRVVDGVAVPDPFRLPHRFRARLAGRFAGLSPGARHLVQAASTLRSPFPPARLGALLGGTVIGLLPAIEEAFEAGFLVAAGDVISFCHELARPVVEDSLPGAVVAALHSDQALRTNQAPRSNQASYSHRPPHANKAPAAARRERPVVVADWGALSDRELEIAGLVGLALTNRQIASRVSRSPHTVSFHLRQIFRKLGLTSRVELVSLLRRRENTDRSPAGNVDRSSAENTRRSPAGSAGQDPAA